MINRITPVHIFRLTYGASDMGFGRFFVAVVIDQLLFKVIFHGPQTKIPENISFKIKQFIPETLPVKCELLIPQDCPLLFFLQEYIRLLPQFMHTSDDTSIRQKGGILSYFVLQDKYSLDPIDFPAKYFIQFIDSVRVCKISIIYTCDHFPCPVCFLFQNLQLNAPYGHRPEGVGHYGVFIVNEAPDTFCFKPAFQYVAVSRNV